MNRPMLLPPDHPDRQVSVEERLRENFQWVLTEAEAAGIGESEAATAFEHLAHARLDHIASMAETRRLIDPARADADQEPIHASRTPATRRHLIVGVLFWFAVGFALWIWS